MIVAIDGPAGTGKSTVAREVAAATGFAYVSSGSLYRAITYHVLERGIDPSSDAVVREAHELALDVTERGATVNGRELVAELRTPAVDRTVASLSAIPGVRDVVNAALRRVADDRDIIVEGRDMTTVVFPEAEVKVYLDATLEARARRRHEEHGKAATYEQIRSEIGRRDAIDTTKPVGRLKLHPSALYIDSSALTIRQVCEIVLHAIHAQDHTTGAVGQS